MKVKTKDQIKGVLAFAALMFLMGIAGTMDYQAAVEAETYQQGNR